VVSGHFNILTVCTMNICRSPAMELRLRTAADQKCGQGSESLVQIHSAGTDAIAGTAGCELSLAYAGSAEPDFESRVLTAELLDEVDLVLIATWQHSAKIVPLQPQIRSRCFPLRLAARLATLVVASQALPIAVAKASGEQIDSETAGQLAMVAALPGDAAGRLRWLVSEMNEARGIAPRPPEDNLPYGIDDIPDPHVLGYNLHELSATMIAESTQSLVSAAEVVVNCPQGDTTRT